MQVQSVQNIFIYERIIILLKKHSYMSLPTGDYVIKSLVQWRANAG